MSHFLVQSLCLGCSTFLYFSVPLWFFLFISFLFRPFPSNESHKQINRNLTIGKWWREKRPGFNCGYIDWRGEYSVPSAPNELLLRLFSANRAKNKQMNTKHWAHRHSCLSLSLSHSIVHSYTNSFLVPVVRVYVIVCVYLWSFSLVLSWFFLVIYGFRFVVASVVTLCA